MFDVSGRSVRLCPRWVITDAWAGQSLRTHAMELDGSEGARCRLRRINAEAAHHAHAGAPVLIDIETIDLDIRSD